ncbi:MAG: hypothetical protein RIG61_02860 [Deltaproteobacteria bacterium]
MNSCSVVKFIGYYRSADSGNDGKLDGLVYTSDDTTYRIGALPGDWKRLDIEGGDLAYNSLLSDSTITVNSTCDPKKKNYSLKALSESLLIGIKDKKAVKREETSVDGQKALSSIYTGSINGAPVKIETVVFRKGECIYDFTYASPPDSFDDGEAVFEEFISQFRVL